MQQHDKDQDKSKNKLANIQKENIYVYTALLVPQLYVMGFTKRGAFARKSNNNKFAVKFVNFF